MGSLPWAHIFISLGALSTMVPYITDLERVPGDLLIRCGLQAIHSTFLTALLLTICSGSIYRQGTGRISHL